MPKYAVIVERTDTFEVEIDAEDEDLAGDEAVDLLDQSEDPWKEYGMECNGFSVLYATKK